MPGSFLHVGHSSGGEEDRPSSADLHERVRPERPRLLERHELDVRRRQRLVRERRHQLALSQPRLCAQTVTPAPVWRQSAVNKGPCML